MVLLVKWTDIGEPTLSQSHVQTPIGDELQAEATPKGSALSNQLSNTTVLDRQSTYYKMFLTGFLDPASQ